MKRKILCIVLVFLAVMALGVGCAVVYDDTAPYFYDKIDLPEYMVVC